MEMAEINLEEKMLRATADAVKERNRLADLLLEYGACSEAWGVYETCAEIIRTGELPS